MQRLTLQNEHLVVDILTLGATIQRLRVKDAAGVATDVVLGYRTLAEYEADRFFLGAVVGRYANRIANGRFDLDGRTHQLPRNDAGHTLHGGPDGFHRQVWVVVPGAASESSVLLEHVSVDGSMGFPGTLHATCSYTIHGPELAVELRAVTERPTVVNLTQHAYFNLAGVGRETVEDHELWLEADRYLPVDGTGLPLGSSEPVAGTPFDFRTPRRIGARLLDADEQLATAGGYDHCFLANSPVPGHVVARLGHPASGRAMEVRTDQPGLQLYTGNRLDGSGRGIHGHHRQFDGVCLETQQVPDGPNRPEADAVTLRPGEEYVARTTWRFSTEAPKPPNLQERP